MLTEGDRARFRSECLERFPDADRVFQDYAVSFETIAHFLGRHWVFKNMNPKEGNPFFLFQASDSVEAYLRQHRVISLGNRLFELQNVPGFEEAVREIRCRDLAGATAELWAVSKLRARGNPVAFNKRTGHKGQDFDASVTIAGLDVAVEVKAKKEHPEPRYREAAIVGPLKKARQQVPTTGPSLVFLHIPSDWASNRWLGSSIEGAVRSFLPKARRINAVVLMFDARVPGERGGMAFLGGHEIIPNQRPKIAVPSVLGLLGGLRLRGTVRFEGPRHNPD